MNYPSLLQTFIVSTIPIAWYGVGHIPTDVCKNVGFWVGSILSHHCQRVPMWDTVCEPFIARQFCSMFIFTNGILEGMKSDNTGEDLTRMDMAIYSAQDEILYEIQKNRTVKEEERS